MKLRVVYVSGALTPDVHSNFAKQLQGKKILRIEGEKFGNRPSI